MSALEVRLELPLDSFRLEVEFTAASRVTGLFGASGAGKTHLLRAIAGLERRALGRVAFGGEVWLDTDHGRRLPPEARAIGYLPQEGLLFPHLDVRGNLLSGARRARRAGEAIGQRLDRVARVLELGPLLDRPADALSGGERQRVALGRAICSAPALLLLDEPLASLDLALRRRVLPFLVEVRDAFGIPIVLVSHDPAEVQALCDELLVLDRGRIVVQGPVREALTDPRVLPIAGPREFENVLTARVLEHRGATSLVGVGGGVDGEAPPLTLVVPRAPGAVGEPLVLGLPAREIVVAAKPPEGLSARNLVPATVRWVRGDGDLRLLVADPGEGLPDLAVAVTAEACADLGLAPGRRVHLVAKTASFVLYGGERQPPSEAKGPAVESA